MVGPDGDLRVAWRAKLAREGKLAPDAGTLRDLVVGPVDDAGAAAGR